MTSQKTTLLVSFQIHQAKKQCRPHNWSYFCLWGEPFYSVSGSCAGWVHFNVSSPVFYFSLAYALYIPPACFSHGLISKHLGRYSKNPSSPLFHFPSQNPVSFRALPKSPRLTDFYHSSLTFLPPPPNPRLLPDKGTIINHSALLFCWPCLLN